MKQGLCVTTFFLICLALAERFVGRPRAFAMGWNYVVNWLIVLPAELSAATVLMSYWSTLNPAIWISGKI